MYHSLMLYLIQMYCTFGNYNYAKAALFLSFKCLIMIIILQKIKKFILALKDAVLISTEIAIFSLFVLIFIMILTSNIIS